MQDLLDTTAPHLSIHDDPELSAIVGLDMSVIFKNRTDIRGTGASCIYPLLACTIRPWTMYGTGHSPPLPKVNVADIDTKSIQFANENVRTNNLQSRINILATVNESPL